MIKPKKPPYATTTKDPDTTIADINRMLRSYGVNDIQWTTLWDQKIVSLKFMIEKEPGKNVGIKIFPPLFAAKRKTYNEKRGHYEVIEVPSWSQSLRLLYWWLKVKIEAIAYGLREIEEEFLHDVVVRLPSGEETTIGAAILPGLKEGRLDFPQLGEGE